MNLKERVIQWIAGGSEYDAGVMIFASASKNNVLKKTFAGREYRYKDKLYYELVKLSKLTSDEIAAIEVIHKEQKQHTANPAIPGTDNPVGENGPQPSATDPENTGTNNQDVANADSNNTELNNLTTICGIAVADVDMQPKEVRRVLFEYRDLYTQRALLHKSIFDVPEENSDENIAKRKEIRDQIVAVGFRLDQLYKAITLFTETGTLPNEAELWPVQPETIEPELPTDIEDLKKLKKGLQTSLAKDKNKLEFQQDTKAEAPNPMPEGPDRLKIEQRIAKKQKQIEDISYKLIELAN